MLRQVAKLGDNKNAVEETQCSLQFGFSLPRSH